MCPGRPPACPPTCLPTHLPCRFKRFLTYGSDFHQLLLSTLRGLLQDEQRNVRLVGAALGEEETYKIPLRCTPETTWAA